MVKLLIGGNLQAASGGSGGGGAGSDGSEQAAAAKEGWTTLTARVKALQESQHGPFAALFISGGLFQNAEQYQFALSAEAPQLCLPTHLTTLPAFASASALPPNVFFNGTGLATVATLTVCYLSSTASPDDVSSLRDKTSHPTYRGCDLLLTEDWPREMHHFIEESEYLTLQACLEPGTMGLGSATVASVATIVRPRYHFSAARNVFFQRSPYRSPAVPTEHRNVGPYGPSSSSSSQASQVAPCTRFVSLANVSQSKDKDKKWLHALSLEPITYLSAADVALEPQGTTDCPYVQVGTLSKPGSRLASQQSLQDRVANGEPDSKRRRGTGSGAIFFGNQGIPRADSVGSMASGAPQLQVNLVPPSITATTLFIANMPRGMRLDNELRQSLQGCISVRSQEGKSFVFAEFESHDAALRMVEGANKQGFFFQGRQLAIGWASSQSRPAGGSRPAGVPMSGGGVVLPPAPPAVPPPDCKVLFVGGLSFVMNRKTEEGPPLVSVISLSPVMPGLTSVRLVPNQPYAFAEFSSHEAAAAVMESTRSGPLVIEGPAREDGSTGYEVTLGWARSEQKPSAPSFEYRPHTIITSPPSLDSKTLFLGGLPESTEEAVVDDASVQQLFASITGTITVRRPEGKNFAFLEFASNEDAGQAMSLGPLSMHGTPVTLGWAKGRSMEGVRRSDHEENCWFCLASPQLKMHLIMSVGGSMYLALPRGGMHPLHCLICPIECVPNRIHLPPQALKEFGQYESAVETLFASKGLSALRFERCIRTDGKDHMQEQLIPVPADRVPGAVSIFLQQVSASGLKFREMDERSVDETVVSMEGGPYQEYFFASVPVSNGGSKRFLFVLEEEPLQGTTDGRSKHRFPMNFGNELAAAILGQPDKAHWKKCLVSQQEEEKLAEEFRVAFAPHDLTTAEA